MHGIALLILFHGKLKLVNRQKLTFAKLFIELKRTAKLIKYVFDLKRPSKDEKP